MRLLRLMVALAMLRAARALAKVADDILDREAERRQQQRRRI